MGKTPVNGAGLQREDGTLGFGHLSELAEYQVQRLRRGKRLGLRYTSGNHSYIGGFK